MYKNQKRAFSERYLFPHLTNYNMELKMVPFPEPTPPDKLLVHQRKREAGYTGRVKQFLVEHLPEYFENGLRMLDPNIKLPEEFKERMRESLSVLSIYTEKDLPMRFWRKWMLKTPRLREYFGLHLPHFEAGKRPHVYVAFPYSESLYDLPHNDSPQGILYSLFHEVGHYLNATMGGWDRKKILENLSSAESWATFFGLLCLSQCKPEDLAGIVGLGESAPPSSPEYRNHDIYYIPFITLTWLSQNNILNAQTIVDCFLSKEVDINHVRKNVDGRFGKGTFDALFPKDKEIKDAMMSEWEKPFATLVDLSQKNNLPLSNVYVTAVKLRSRLPPFKNEQAMRMLEKEAEENPTPELYGAIADAYYHLREEGNALKYYTKAIESGSKNPHVYGRRAYFYLSKGYEADFTERAGWYKKAVADYTKAIELDSSNHPLFHRSRARAYAKLGLDYPEKYFNANEDITKEIELSKHFTDGRKAWLYTKRGDNYYGLIKDKKFELKYKAEEAAKGKLQREVADLYAKAISDYQKAVDLYPREDYKETLERLRREYGDYNK